MRTETEMFDLILNAANADERIKAVVMGPMIHGSNE